MNWTDSLLFAVALFTGLTGFALLCAGILGFQSCDVRFSIGGLVDALLTDGIITMVKDLFKNWQSRKELHKIIYSGLIAVGISLSLLTIMFWI